MEDEINLEVFLRRVNALIIENNLDNVKNAEIIIGIPKGTIGNCKRTPPQKPGINNLIKIANYFKCSIDYLIGRDQFVNQQTGDDYTEPIIIKEAYTTSMKIGMEAKDNLAYLQEDLSNEEMARIGGISVSTYLSYLSGTTPSVKALVNFSRYFQVSINHILGVSYSDEELSIDELKLLNTYRTVDIYGQRAINMVSFIELERIEDMKNFSSTASSAKLAAYRSQPDMQNAVDRLLGIDDDTAEYITGRAVAKGGKSRKLKISPEDMAEVHRLHEEEVKAKMKK